MPRGTWSVVMSALALALLTGVVATSAGAATRVSLTDEGNLQIVDTSGAVDDLYVLRRKSGGVDQFTVDRPGGATLPGAQPLQAGNGCSAPSANEVICAVSTGTTLAVSADLGAGDDRLAAGRSHSGAGTSSISAVVANFNVTASGGAGNDDLGGCEGTDVLDGGDGDDTVRSVSAGSSTSGESCLPGTSNGLCCTATGSPHQLLGGAGSDTLINGTSAADTYDGGAGTDTVLLTGCCAGGTSFVWDATLDGAANDIARRPPPLSPQQQPTDNLLATVENLTGVGNLTGTAAKNVLTGSSTDDVLVGGSPASTAALRQTPTGPSSGVPGTVGGVTVDDTLSGLGGKDTLSGQGGNDVMDGGDGDDVLNGGAGTDAMTGGNGNDTLNPGDGGGRIHGNAGDDRLNGGAGVDTFFGEDGADTIDSRDGIAESQTCGAGVDVVTADLKDTVASDCENASIGPVKDGPNLVVVTRSARVRSGGLVTVRVRCPKALGHACAGRLSVGTFRAGRRSLGRPAMAYRVGAGASRTVTVAVSAAARARLRSRVSVLGAVTSVESAAHGPKTTVRRLSLRR